MRDSTTLGPMRGRDRELEAMDERLTALRGGRGGVLLLDGRPGLGKSRLLEELAARAARANCRVLAAAAVDGQQRLPFAPLMAALLSAPAPIVEARKVRELGDRVDMGYWLVHDLVDGLAGAAARRPTVIILDDLQWADPGTVTALRALIAGLRGSPVLWALAARRSQSDDPVRDLFTHLATDGAKTVELGELAPDAVTEVVTDAVGADAAPPLIELAASAGGHPRWLTQLMLGLHEDDLVSVVRGRATVDRRRVPGRVTRLMRERLESLTRPAARMLRIAAVLPPRFAAHQLAELLGGHPADLIEPLDEAIRADVVAVAGTEMCLRPRLLREATRATVAGSLRRVLEREAAEVLLRTGADPLEVARTLAEVAQPGDRAAAATLRTAARALAVSDTNAAADLAVRALDLLAATDLDRGACAADAADLLHRAGRVAEAERLAGNVLTGLSDPQQEAELRLTMSSLIARPPTARLRDNRIALTLLGVSPRIRAGHHGLLAHNLMMAGDHEGAQRLAHRMLAEEPAPAPRLVLAGTYVAHGAGDLASAEIDALLGTGRGVPEPPAQYDVLLATLLHCLGRGDEGAAVLDDCLRRARRERNGPLLALATQVSAQVNLVRGRLAEAQAGPDHGSATVLGMITQIGLAVHLGDGERLRSVTATAKVLRAAESATERRWAGRVLAIAAIQRDDPAYACRLLGDDPLLPLCPPSPYDVSFLVAAARAAIAAEDSDLTGRIVAAAAALGAAGPTAPAFAAGSEHLRGLVEADESRLAKAVDGHLAAGRPLLAAAALEDAGGADRLHRAFDAYQAAGAVADAQRVGRRLRRCGELRRVMTPRPETGWASLTDAELKVVRVIATGATNRDVAQRLFISHHTVNAHVRNVFAKLGIASRVQLTNLVRDNDG